MNGSLRLNTLLHIVAEDVPKLVLKLSNDEVLNELEELDELVELDELEVEVVDVDVDVDDPDVDDFFEVEVLLVAVVSGSIDSLVFVAIV